VSPPLTACLFVTPEGSYPKPSISVSPSGVIPVGGNVNIRCWHLHQNMRFQLYKAGDGNYLSYTDPAGSEAEFPITSARREHGGSYTCRYTYRSGGTVYSEPSDPVQIIVTGEGPSLAPRLLAHTKPEPWCPADGMSSPGQCRGLEFALYKAGARNAAAWGRDSAGVKFPIPKVSRAEEGSYTCYYPPDTWSEPRDPMELVVGSEGPLLLVLSSAPTENSRAPSSLEPPFRELKADINPHLILLFCSWRPGLGGCLGLVLTSCLLCADPSLPRPSISLSPSGVTAPGADVTIQCQGPRWDVRFFLHKAGDLNPQQHMDRTGAGAEFRIPTVGRQHGGSYSCSYRPQSEPFVCSQPSNTVELVVAGERPSSVVDSVTGGFPSWGSRSSWGFRAEGGEISDPGGSCRAGAFPRGCSSGYPHTGNTQRSQGPGAAELAPAPATNPPPRTDSNDDAESGAEVD
uniref:Immunoglobulin domain-containing protein n=1 Tax=Gopherus agassizii TaxID=38772 RepID=A0A452GVX6_9SAUR